MNSTKMNRKKVKKQTVQKSQEKVSNLGVKPVDLCDLIDVCAKSNVAELKYGDLHVLFGSFTSRIPTAIGTPSQFNADETVMKEELEKNLLNAEISTQEMEMDELILADPVEFEKRLHEGELTDDTDSE